MASGDKTPMLVAVDNRPATPHCHDLLRSVGPEISFIVAGRRAIGGVGLVGRPRRSPAAGLAAQTRHIAVVEPVPRRGQFSCAVDSRVAEIAENAEMSQTSGSAIIRGRCEAPLEGSPLPRTLRSTNSIESMISICRNHSANVKNWQNGDMALRWCAASTATCTYQYCESPRTARRRAECRCRPS